MKPKTEKVFLSAICGTAMASLAGMLKQAGYQVFGSDNAVYPPMSTLLEDLGIRVYKGFSADNIQECDPNLVVIGNTLSRGNPEVEFVLDEGIRYASMAETVKDLFIRGRQSIVVSGTHGKTTTTAMLAWMLESAGQSPSFLVGGIAENFKRSFQIGSGSQFVIEGDEYDTAFFDKSPKFLHYMPQIALIKNIEFDHADIYTDLKSIQLSFKRMINIVPSKGLIVAGTDSPAVVELLEDLHSRVSTFGIRSGDWRADSIEVSNEHTGFDVVRNGNFWRRFLIPLVGEFNVYNALSAIIACDEMGLSTDQIQIGFQSFKSVRRRLEIRGTVRGVTIYDDFAHHPTAVAETLRGVRIHYPEARIWAIFEPRSQTARRRIFEDEFVDALGNADVALVAPPFSTVHLNPENVIRPEIIVRSLREIGKQAYTFRSTDEIVEFIARNTQPGDRLVVMSNGGFENIHQRLLDVLSAS